MTVVLWIVQGLLALAYLMAGGMKASRPIAALSKSMAWVRSVPPGFVRSIGVAEVLGAIGIILPLATGVLPWLTVAAAVGLVIVQVCAIAFHLARGETQRLAMNAVLLLLAVFVVVGRVALVPIA
ncbi:MAG TPA: DoxX family protein [Ktedonobacterales bacterium]|nr:DoxX family protein [Ktedonobacterales bacterium]